MGNDISSHHHHSKGSKKDSSSQKDQHRGKGGGGANAEVGVASGTTLTKKRENNIDGTSTATATATATQRDNRMDTVPLEREETEETTNTKTTKKSVSNSNSISTKPPPPRMEPSVNTFGPSNNRRRAPDARSSDVMITDALSDVRERYHINPREIGHGHYGVVRKCMDRQTKEWLAIKSIRKSKVGKIEVLKREIEILKEVDHPNIIKLISVHEDSKYIHLITELCTGGELFDRIIAKTQTDEGHFSERDAANLIRDILDAIHYCHETKQIVHRDLKPENFLFLTQHEHAPVKIIDFGLSRHDDNAFGVMKTKVGTPYYVAPEVLNREYTKSCDIWSIGVITYILLCGYPPFYGDSDNQIFESVRNGRFDFPSPDWDTVSVSAKDFICSLLKMNPNQRLTAKQALQHKWIQEKTDPHSSISHKSSRSTAFAKFKSMQKLKKAALAYIATHLTQSEVGVLGDIFHDLDKLNTGFITLSQLNDALDHGNFSTQLRTELSQLREDLRLNGEESLNWRDFLAATMDKSVAFKEDKIRHAFNHFRRSSDAHIKQTDLVELFGSEAQAKEIMGDVDCDGDGRISYEEFKNMLAGTINQKSDI